ncbi:MAG: hypothetical protein H6719_06575 [Sandaracinaceae bacterium]|nr:hypothetical protein [Sandaracinaceae bacterium]
MNKVVIATLILALAGCGDEVRYDETRGTARPTDCEPTAGGEQGTPDDLSELMAEVIAPRICDRVLGSFIGLPGEETHEGPEGGLDPSVGRWWIRRCEAQVVGGRLNIAFGGPGWTWLDRESMGFRVRQYLRMDASASFTASLHIGYDPRSRVASVWLRPQPGVRAVVEPTGLVQAEATGVFSSVLGGLLNMAGGSPSDQARTQAAEEGSQRLAATLQTGFSVTFELDTEQLDFMLGQLPRGATPQRPWPSNGIPWLVNERSAVWPGGIDVLGPIPADVGQVSLEIELEEGQGMLVRRVCADAMHSWLDAAWGGRNPPSLNGATIATLTSAHAPQTVALTALECPALLVVTTTEGAQTPAFARYRVTSETAREAAPPAVAAPAPPTPIPAGGVRAVRIQIRSLVINGRDAAGDEWDVLGGDPDPYVVVTSVREGREIHRTPTIDDSREPRFDQWIPSSIPASSLPLRVVVYDDDVGGDEVVGAASIDASVLSGGETDLSLPLMSRGENAGQTGTLRIRVQPQR